MVEPADIVNLARKFSFANLVCGDDQDLLRADGHGRRRCDRVFRCLCAGILGGHVGDFLWFFHYDADEPPYYRRVRAVGRDGRAFGLMPVTPQIVGGRGE